MVVITVASYFFGTDLINQHLHSAIADAMGDETADQVQEMIIVALRSKDSVWAAVLGMATILLGATGVFVQFQKSLNIIWEVKATTKKSGVLTFFKNTVVFLWPYCHHSFPFVDIPCDHNGVVCCG